MLPAVQAAGIDLLWFGIFVILVVEMAQITPPVGFNLFVVQNLTGHDMWKRWPRQASRSSCCWCWR